MKPVQEANLGVVPRDILVDHKQNIADVARRSGRAVDGGGVEHV